MTRIGIALSGGAARCIAHLGVLEVLVRERIPIHVLSGTSGGALVGALHGSGQYTIGELIRFADRLRWWQVTRPVISTQGLLSSHRIGHFLRRFLGEMTFDQMAIPFAAVATDLGTGKKVVLRQGSVAKAVQASCSLPVIFKPTEYGDQVLVDGGYVSQIPVLAAKQELQADFVIAVDVNYGGMERVRPPRHSIPIAIHMASLWARKNAEEEGRQADHLVRVNVSGISLTNLRRARELLDRGRFAAESELDELRNRLRKIGLP